MTKWLPAQLEGGGPLYQSLADAIERAIGSGALKPGERLPTHRDMADGLSINVSTVTRGYKEAEQRGLVSGTVGRGTFVASDAATATAMVSFEPGEPGMTEMGLVAPLFHLDPDVSEGFKRIARRKDPGYFLRYSDPRGLTEHRQAGADWARRYGLETGPESVVVCAGAQHALTCCLTGLLRPGDRLATDALTYPGMKTLAAMLGLRLVPVAMDDQGMIPESLDAACRRDAIKAVYLMPGVHNPTTVTIPEARRDRLAALADTHDLMIIEDDAYDLTAPDSPAPLAARVPHRTLYVAGLSKSIAAGLRVAFLVAPPHCRKPLARAVLNTIWMAPPLNVELAAMWINNGTADKVVEQKRMAAARRYMTACDVLDGLRFRGKPSGFYVWLDLPGDWTGAAFEAAARTRNINVFGAEKFVVGEVEPPRAARISLTGVESMDEFEAGLTALREIVDGTPQGAGEPWCNGTEKRGV